MLPAMKGLRTVLDLLLTAPGEKPGALIPRESAVQPRSSSSSVATTQNTVFLLLDVSQSMDEPKLRQARAGSVSFAEDAVGKGYRVGVIQFSTFARLRVEPTTNRRTIEKGLSHVGLQMTTNMAAAIELATSLLDRMEGQRAMVLVTDGYPDDASAALEAAERAKRQGITIIAIGTDDADRNLLKKLASASELATTVPDRDLGVTIAKAALLLPAKTTGSR
jgi:Mg-chelatase subunit ChlD